LLFKELALLLHLTQDSTCPSPTSTSTTTTKHTPILTTPRISSPSATEAPCCPGIVYASHPPLPARPACEHPLSRSAGRALESLGVRYGLLRQAARPVRLRRYCCPRHLEERVITANNTAAGIGRSKDSLYEPGASIVTIPKLLTPRHTASRLTLWHQYWRIRREMLSRSCLVSVLTPPQPQSWPANNAPSAGYLENVCAARYPSPQHTPYNAYPFLQQRAETDFFTGAPLEALTTLVYSDNVDLQRSASLTFAEITERGEE
jgi:hypothetical protein